ncbi:MAG: anti-sigma factor antagonist [Sphingobacteriaceae bacterium]|nr:MAG: anti-sigma factor antagonist [Sphingobacteriaceae bacterium]
MINIQDNRTNHLLTKVDITEANLNNADKFRDELVGLLDQHQKKVVVDLGSISYMDSSFLGALVSALKYAISVNSDVILVGLRKDIYELFTLIRLDKVFKIYKDFDEATAAV